MSPKKECNWLVAQKCPVWRGCCQLWSPFESIRSPRLSRELLKNSYYSTLIYDSGKIGFTLSLSCTGDSLPVEVIHTVIIHFGYHSGPQLVWDHKCLTELGVLPGFNVRDVSNPFNVPSVLLSAWHKCISSGLSPVHIVFISHLLGFVLLPTFDCISACCVIG